MKGTNHIFHSLTSAYLRYFDSAFGLRFDELARERRQLLAQDGVLYRDPLVEPQPRYVSNKESVADAIASALTGCWLPEETNLLANMATSGLFARASSGLKLYEHQTDMLQAVTREKMNAVILAGTGSGKTEAIYLPVLAALVRESHSWPTGKTIFNNKWWRLQAQDGSRKYHPRISQREHESTGRTAAVRALVIYPLNALAEDQISRLRLALDSSAARDWYATNCPGNRFWFGRYTGETPLPQGASESDLRKTLRGLEDLSERVKDTPAEHFFQDMDGGEMWSRKDMQDSPPDILVSNYSMLNIMLMREVEAPIFEKTRKWLQESPDNIFHLVVDELHSYRGTQGTEIGYVLRVLFDRIGISPNHPQLRIIASSASLGSKMEDSNQSIRKFLKEFFGCELSFRIIKGAVEPPQISSTLRVDGFHDQIIRLGEAMSGDSTEQTRAIEAFAEDTGITPANSSLGIAQRLGSIINQLELPDSISRVCTKQVGDGIEICPKSLSDIGKDIFPGLESVIADQATSECFNLLSKARNQDQTPLLQTKIHLFFRNVQGIWACSSPSCTSVVRNNKNILVGKLYNRPSITCKCGSRVLEMLYCEACGDIFLGGFRKTLAPNTWILLPDDPNIERAPDYINTDRCYGSYAVYWPARTHDGELREPVRCTWTHEKVKREWRKAEFDPLTGKILPATSLQSTTGWMYFVPQLHKPNSGKLESHPSANNDRPSLCPNCEANWRSMATISPIRNQRTGFQKISQLLADTLLREIPAHDNIQDITTAKSTRKLVVFSDSRQDAAKLSVGIAKSHWQDALRKAFCDSMSEFPLAVAAFLKFCGRVRLSPKEQALANRFRNAFPRVSSDLMAAYIQNIPNVGAVPENSGATNHADWLLRRASKKLAGIVELEALTHLQLLENGMNPGGVDRSVMWTNLEEHTGVWADLFNWDQSPPTVLDSLSGSEQTHKERIQNSAREAIALMAFSGGGRDFESLQLGIVTYDFVRFANHTSVVQETVNSCIRLLGIRRRIDLFRATQDDSELPYYVKKYISAVEEKNGLPSDSLHYEVVSLLEKADAFCDGILVYKNLFVTKSFGGIRKCSRCARIHLHNSGGICCECLTPLDESGSGCGQGSKQDMDYYRWLATEAGPVTRLNCEEMTGQTDRSLARDRQRLFQDVTIGDEREKTSTIDLLCVTTTMEAGVDIGALLLVMMANMPPKRFNYQQRAGRCGRRNAPLSFALTLCRGRSHDDYYFQRPERITSDTPPVPYIDTNHPKIARRILAKETLRMAFQDLGLYDSSKGDSVHGEFGESSAWNQPPKIYPDGYSGANVSDIIYQWIQRHTGEITRVCKVLLLGTQMQDELNIVDDLVNWVSHQLVTDITNASLDASLIQSSLSDRLANKGILPMFGFPTRSRFLYHQRPKTWPPRHVVDRELELAISMFAPGAETIKERTIHTSIGVAHYLPGQAARVYEGEDPLGMSVKVALCGSCHHVEDSGINCSKCPVCSEPEGTDDKSFRYIDLRQPKGFISYFTKARDYDGVFDFVPRASRPKIGKPNFEIHQEEPDNFRVGAGPTRLYIINDNSGNLYHFERNSLAAGSRGYIDVDAVNSAESKHAATVPGQLSKIRKRSDDSIHCALAAITETDALVFDVHSFPKGLSADPRTVEGRAALYSLAFMIRKAAAVFLDIDDYELVAGINSRKDQNSDKVHGQIFLSDKLENGAGYASHVGNSHVMRQLLEMISQPSSSEFYDRIIASTHLQSCLTSCHDCIRSYNNLAYHSLLDWRLALDMAKLALSSSASVSLSGELWSTATKVAIDTMNALRPQSHVEVLEGLPVLISEKNCTFVTHPLWSTDQRPYTDELEGAVRIAEGRGLDASVEFVSVFRALRGPA